MACFLTEGSREGAPVYNIICHRQLVLLKPLVEGAPQCGTENTPFERDPGNTGARIPVALFLKLWSGREEFGVYIKATSTPPRGIPKISGL